MDNIVYMLECVDGSIYIGYTNNLKARFLKHNSGKGAKYTRSKLPVKLKYFEYTESKSTALKKEYSLKKLSKLKKLEYIEANLTLEKIKIINEINM